MTSTRAAIDPSQVAHPMFSKTFPKFHVILLEYHADFEFALEGVIDPRSEISPSRWP